MQESYSLSLTTQGPLYPPSEMMDNAGNFIVIGAINRPDGAGGTSPRWGSAIVSANSPVPAFGSLAPYTIVEEFDDQMPGHLADRVLYTLPLPLPCSNYPMVFAPEQFPDANAEIRSSYPFHQTPIPDAAPEHGRKITRPITLGDWMQAEGTLRVTRSDDARSAVFEFEFSGLVPDSLYTVMTLRARDLDPAGPTRPGPLGVPNVFVSDRDGNARYRATLPDPFPRADSGSGNRVINVVVLWMSYQMSHGGAIGRFGLGGDIHAHLKLRAPAFGNFETKA